MKHIFLLTLMSALGLISCSENRMERSEQPQSRSTKCYMSVIRNDSMMMQITVNDDQVEGLLQYNFDEKDDNNGSIAGTLKGDTLFLDYTYNAEGKTSVREIAFLYDDKKYIPGYGPMEELNGKLIFKDKLAIRFDEAHAFKTVECQ